jgi:hypothetical protein
MRPMEFPGLSLQTPAITPDDVKFITAVTIVLVVLGAMQAIHGIVAIVNFFRASPPIHEVYATKEELSSAITRIEKHMSVDDRKEDERFKEIFRQLDGIHRSLGRLEGRDDTRPL